MASMPLAGQALISDHQQMMKVILGPCLFLFRAPSLSKVPSTLHQDISPRSDTVRKLAALLDKNRVVHVRGPPSSGKTTLAHLLELYYTEKGQSVKVITGWNQGADRVTQQHQDQQEETNRFYIENRLHTKTVFIIDEAQESFADHSLWLGPIKGQSGASGGARICIFSSYGSPTGGLPGYPDAQASLYLEPSQRVSITEQSDPESSGICLFYTEEECEDAVNRLCSRPDMALDMDPSAREYLYSMTKGHPGAVEAIVSHVLKNYTSEDGTVRTVTKELFSRSFVDESRVFRSLRHFAVFVEYMLHALQLKPFPFDRFPCLATLCEAILKCFSRTRLLSDPVTSHLPNKFVRPPETPFQDEWYRCFASLVGHGVGISSKWSCTGNERVDFRIIGPAWGVELLRDGDQIHSVCARFQQHGLYHPLIENGQMTDWLILDCRQSAPQKYHVPGTKLWRVVFKNDYTSAYVLDSDNAVVVPEFDLLD
ncbi:ATP-binding protein [Aspergillus affinis]|uniref:ATP-binding protein n=1 Tax=Aspergillus affinis TaxID=1070780 RepID=UPI0022FE1A0D|nr:uncharacterized protein KD926_001052 [Aspergillus affinis]KAI9044451.1 hypothetical protein KD926_001052 [Aspergillus affinis]